MQEVTVTLPWWGEAIALLLIGGGAVWGFQAAFKSGKRETKVDAWFDKVLADPGVPAGVKALAQKAKDLELTQAAQGIKTFVDPRVDALEAKLRELEARLTK